MIWPTFEYTIAGTPESSQGQITSSLDSQTRQQRMSNVLDTDNEIDNFSGMDLIKLGNELVDLLDKVNDDEKKDKIKKDIETLKEKMMEKMAIRDRLLKLEGGIIVGLEKQLN